MQESILTEQQLNELNPEHIEINTVVDDISMQDLVNEDTIEVLNEQAEIENEQQAEVEQTEAQTAEQAEVEGE